MPSIQIKDVPEETHRTLRRRAAESHQSLQEYLRAHLVAVASHPTVEEVFARIEARPGRVEVSIDDINEDVRADRDRH